MSALQGELKLLLQKNLNAAEQQTLDNWTQSIEIDSTAADEYLLDEDTFKLLVQHFTDVGDASTQSGRNVESRRWTGLLLLKLTTKTASAKEQFIELDPRIKRHVGNCLGSDSELLRYISGQIVHNALLAGQDINDLMGTEAVTQYSMCLTQNLSQPSSSQYYTKFTESLADTTDGTNAFSALSFTIENVIQHNAKAGEIVCYVDSEDQKDSCLHAFAFPFKSPTMYLDIPIKCIRTARFAEDTSNKNRPIAKVQLILNLTSLGEPDTGYYRNGQPTDGSLIDFHFASAGDGLCQSAKELLTDIKSAMNRVVRTTEIDASPSRTAVTKTGSSKNGSLKKIGKTRLRDETLNKEVSAGLSQRVSKSKEFIDVSNGLSPNRSSSTSGKNSSAAASRGSRSTATVPQASTTTAKKSSAMTLSSSKPIESLKPKSNKLRDKMEDANGQLREESVVPAAVAGKLKLPMKKTTTKKGTSTAKATLKTMAKSGGKVKKPVEFPDEESDDEVDSNDPFAIPKEKNPRRPVVEDATKRKTSPAKKQPQAKTRAKASNAKKPRKVVELSDDEEESRPPRRSTRASTGKIAKVDYVETSTQQDIEDEEAANDLSSRQKRLTKPAEPDAVDATDDEDLDVPSRGRQLTRITRNRPRSQSDVQDVEEDLEAPTASRGLQPSTTKKTTDHTTETVSIAPMVEPVQHHEMSHALPIMSKQPAPHLDRFEQFAVKPIIVHFSEDGPANQGTRCPNTTSKRAEPELEDEPLSSDEEQGHYDGGLAPIFDEVDDDDTKMAIEDSGQQDTADDAESTEQRQQHQELTHMAAMTDIPKIKVVPDEPMSDTNVEDPDEIQDLSVRLQVKHSADLEKDDSKAQSLYDGPVIEESQSQKASPDLFSESVQEFTKANAVFTNPEDISLAQQALDVEAGQTHYGEDSERLQHLISQHVISDTIDPRVLTAQFHHDTQHPHELVHGEMAMRQEISQEISFEIERHVDSGTRAVHVEQHISVKRHAVQELREEQPKRLKQSEIATPADAEASESPLSSVPAHDEEDEAVIQDLVNDTVDQMVEDEPESEDELDQPHLAQPRRTSSQLSARVDVNGSPQPVATQPYVTQPTQVIEPPLYDITETNSGQAQSQASDRARDNREKTVTFVTSEIPEPLARDTAAPRPNVDAPKAVSQEVPTKTPLAVKASGLPRVKQAEAMISSSSPERIAQQPNRKPEPHQNLSKSPPPATSQAKMTLRSADHKQAQEEEYAPKPVADARQSTAQKQKLLEVQEQVFKPTSTARTVKDDNARQSNLDAVKQSKVPQRADKPNTPLPDEDSGAPGAFQMPDKTASAQPLTSRPSPMQHNPARLPPAQKAEAEFLKPAPVRPKSKKSTAQTDVLAGAVVNVSKTVPSQRDDAGDRNQSSHTGKSNKIAPKSQVLPHVSTPRNVTMVQKQQPLPKVLQGAPIMPAQVQPVSKIVPNSRTTSVTTQPKVTNESLSKEPRILRSTSRHSLVNSGRHNDPKQAVSMVLLAELKPALNVKYPAQQTRELAAALYNTVQSLRLLPKKQETKIVNLILRRYERSLVLNMLNDEDKLREAVQEAVQAEEEQVRKRNTTLAAGIGQSTEPQPVLPVSSFQQKLLEAGQPPINVAAQPKERSIIDWDDDETTLVQDMDMDDVSSLPQSPGKPRRARRQVHGSGAREVDFDQDDALSEDEDMTLSSPFTSSEGGNHDSGSDTLVEDAPPAVAIRSHEQGVIDAINTIAQAFPSQLISHSQRIEDLALAYERGGLAQIDLLGRCRQQEADVAKQQLVQSRKKLAAGLKTIELNLTKQANDVDEVGKWFEVGQAAWEKRKKEIGKGLTSLRGLC